MINKTPSKTPWNRDVGKTLKTHRNGDHGEARDVFTEAVIF